MGRAFRLASSEADAAGSMIKAAIIGLGWWGSIIHRELPGRRHSPRARRRSCRRGAPDGGGGGLRTTARWTALARDDIRPSSWPRHTGIRGADRCRRQSRQARVLRKTALYQRVGNGRSLEPLRQKYSSASVTNGTSGQASSICGPNSRQKRSAQPSPWRQFQPGQVPRAARRQLAALRKDAVDPPPHTS